MLTVKVTHPNGDIETYKNVSELRQLTRTSFGLVVNRNTHIVVMAVKRLEVDYKN